MVEKRFTLTDWHEVKKNGEVMTVNEVVDCLNEQQLHLIKSSYELCKKQIEIDRLKLKINELQQKIDILCEDAAVCPIIFNESFAFVSSELRDVEVDGLGNFNLTEADLKNYEDYLD